MSSARGCCEPSWSKTIHGRCVFPFPDPSSWVLFPSLGKERPQAASFPWLSSRDLAQGELGVLGLLELPSSSPVVWQSCWHFGLGFVCPFSFLVAHTPGPEVFPQHHNGVCPSTHLPCEPWQLPDAGISRPRGLSGSLLLLLFWGLVLGIWALQ